MKKPSKIEVAKQVKRLRALPSGLSDPEQIDVRIGAVREMLEGRAQSPDHLEAIVRRCLLDLKWVPVPAEVNEIIDQIAAEAIPVWKSPPKPVRTMQDVLEDIAFQKQFALDKPRWAEAVDEILAELKAELEAMKAQS